MKLKRAYLALLCVFALGLVAGVYLQHRWPLGRWREHIARPPVPVSVTLADIAAIPDGRRLVIVVAGQSNAANHGQPRARAGAGVYAYHEGRLYPAADPLPGGTQVGGSIWTRLGARLMLTGDYDAVVFAINAVGSTRAADWAPGGPLHPRLATSLQELAAAGLAPDFFLWHQGETEGWSPSASGIDYLDTIWKILASVRTVSPSTTCVVAQATFGAEFPGNAQIRAAQKHAATLPGAIAGPDLDLLQAGHRSDGSHFNQTGLEAAADLWLAALRPALQSRLAP